MASKIILKKSSVAAKAPVAGDLDFGELAINYTDSKLYFKKADGSIDAFTSAAASAPVTSVATYTGDVTATNLLDAIKTVDGSGSGLDADTLDGLSSASFYLASNPNGYTSNLGTVTNVGATSPVVSSGGATPTISMPAATASVNGYMTSAYASKLDGIAAGATNVTNTNQLTNGAGYITSAASISGNAATATNAQNETFTTAGNANWGGKLQLGGNGIASALANVAVVQSTDGNLHIDPGSNRNTYLNYYNNGVIYLNGTTYNISSNGSNYNGNAATATYAGNAGNADNIDGVAFRNTSSNAPINADTLNSNGTTYYTSGVPNFSGNAEDGALYSQVYSDSWQHQIAGDYRSGQIALRGKNAGAWQSWRRVLDSGNYSSYALPLSGGTLSGGLTVNNATVNVPSGYVSNGNPWGTANSAFFPNGITTAGNTNWIYGVTYLGNAPANGSGAEVQANGHIYNSVSSGPAMHIRRTGSGSAASNTYTALFEQTYGDHSWGVVAEFRAGGSGGADRPSILFSNGYNTSTWSVGFGAADDQFRINQNHGHRNGGWGTERFRIDTGGTPYFNGNVALHAGNYTSYAPSLTGSGASGTWAINVTGSAGSAPWSGITSRPSNIMYYQGFTLDANTMDSNSTGFTYSNNAPATGPIARFSTGGNYDMWLNAGYGGGNTLYFRTRNGDAGSLNSWRALVSYGVNYGDSLYGTSMYDANNTGYYVDLDGTSSLYRVTINNNIIFTNYGRGMIGSYSASRYQAVFAMGESYKLPDDGTSTGSLYGIAWSHPNAGGVAGNLNTHGALIMENGSFLAALSGSIRSRDDMRTPIFYDSNNTGFYIDPNSSSYLHTLVLSGSTYFRPNSWIQLDGSYGLYWPNHYGAHLHANDLSTYTQLSIRGNKNGYGGFYDQYSGVNIAMFDSSGNGGFYREAQGRWYQYYNLANDCTGFGTGTTNSGYNIYAPKGLYSGGRVDSPIFYDTNDTGCYLDLNGTSRFYGAQQFVSNVNTTGSAPPLQAASTNGGGAIMAFHRAGYYAINMGLDSDNVFRIGGWSASANRLQMDMSGNLTMAGNVTAYSDETLKKDWNSLHDSFIEDLAKVKSGTYTRIDNGDRQAGSSAQDWEKLLPEVVSKSNDGILSLAYGNAALVSAVELAKVVVAQEARIKRLESLIEKLI